MKIIISPAKKMKVDTDGLPFHDLPIFLSDAEKLSIPCLGYQRSVE